MPFLVCSIVQEEVEELMTNSQSIEGKTKVADLSFHFLQCPRIIVLYSRSLPGMTNGMKCSILPE